jgi:hypothetical protein
MKQFKEKKINMIAVLKGIEISPALAFTRPDVEENEKEEEVKFDNFNFEDFGFANFLSNNTV